MRAVALTGLLLTLAGALVLSWTDLRGGAPVTWDENAKGFPRTRAAWFGFPLIVLGTALQALAVAFE